MKFCGKSHERSPDSTRACAPQYRWYIKFAVTPSHLFIVKMVVDTTYYDLLSIQVTATSLDIKKAYRKAAIRLHPDKNPDDPSAAARFQEVGEAYQVLSDDKLREKYDKYGKQESIPSEGFEDPAEFFSMIFGGEAFKDWIGELSLLQEMTKSAELSGYSDEPKKEEPKEDVKETTATSSTSYTTTSTTEHFAASEETPSYSAQGPKSTLYLHSTEHTEGSLTKEQQEEKRRKEELEKFEEECRIKKIETRNELANKLVQKLSLFTETDMADDVLESFRQKLQHEAEALKMESFGLEILHTLGSIYKTKAKILLKSQTFLGNFGGLWWSVKEKGGVLRDTFKTVSSALDAQLTMQEYAKMQEDNEYHAKKEAEDEAKLAEEERQKAQEEVNALEEQLLKAKLEQKQESEDKEAGEPGNEGGEVKEVKEEKIPEKHTAEDLQDMEKYLMGKVLAAAWSGSRFEIQGTVRGVCDQILYDKNVPLEKRLAQAKALRIIGQVFSAATRTEVEDEEARIFEELVAEASQKRRKRQPEAATTEEPVSS